MATARLTLQGAKGVSRMLDDMGFGPWTRRALLRAAYLVQSNATTEQIIRGGNFGGTQTPAHPTRITSRTGALRSSIGIDRTELPRFAVEIGSNLVYAGVHEYGNTRTPARPYLQPALDDESREFPGIMMQELDKALREHRGQVGP